MVLLNILGIPTLALLGCYRRKLPQTELAPAWVQWLAICGQIYVVLAVILKLMEIVFAVKIYMHTQWYSVCALMASYLYPIVCQWAQAYISVIVTKKGEGISHEQTKK